MYSCKHWQPLWHRPWPCKEEGSGKLCVLCQMSLCCSYPGYRQSAWRVPRWSTARTCPGKEKQPSGAEIPASDNLPTRLWTHGPPEKEETPSMSTVPFNHELSWLPRPGRAEQALPLMKTKGPCNVSLVCCYSWFLLCKTRRCELTRATSGHQNPGKHILLSAQHSGKDRGHDL